SDEKIYANLADLILSVIPTLLSGYQYEKNHVPSKAPPPPLRGTSPAAAGEATAGALHTSCVFMPR
ncbi:hypothetical protein, partial [Selenomonas felix]|uniref:hypothetical protein n=1 Tax=Selenomonas felix TaxID=1944634 RepID=UPI002355ACB9